MKRLAFAAFILLAVLPAAHAQTTAIRDAIDRLADSTRITREITLRDLGFRDPPILTGADARREIYLPVPAGVAITDASLDLRGRYLRTDGGKATLLLSLDGQPVWSTQLTQDRGDLKVTLPVDGAARRSGFVRLNLGWSSALGDSLCAQEHLIGNVATIDPATRLAYSYDGRAVRDLATAWSALPNEPVILIASRTLSRESYDAAWRIGVALARAGKSPIIRALPAAGETVDTTALNIPDALKALPAFAALARSEKQHTIANNAEIGALIMLGASETRGDLALADQRMASILVTALEALATQVNTASPNTANSIADWRKKAVALADRNPDTDSITLTTLSGRPVISVTPRAGGEAAALFTDLWRRIALTGSLSVRGGESIFSDSMNVPLDRLGGVVGTFDVLARSDWTTTFDLGSVTRDGRIPVELVVDVSAAPGAASSSPVASVVLNDVLLGATRLNAAGKPERISSRIPARILAPRNVLRISFQRQPMSDRCRETPQAYPVDVLPTSHLGLDKATPADDFSGMVTRFAQGGELIVPNAFLTEAKASLPIVIRLADASGLSPEDAQFTVAAARNPVTPKTSFLAFEVPIRGANETTRESGTLGVPGAGSKKIANVSGFDFVAVAEVVRTGDIAGIVYRQVGENAPGQVPPFRLGRGDIAVIGPQGPIAEIEKNEGRAQGNIFTDWLRRIPGLDTARKLNESTMNWGVLVFVAATIFLTLIILLAGIARRRRRDR
jgi:hypothetical protein